MDNFTSYTGLIAAVILPWMLGLASLRLLFYRTGRPGLPVLLGHGYFAGIFLTTLFIRAWDGLGFALNFWPMAFALAGLSVLIYFAGPPSPPGRPVSPPAPRLYAWEKTIIGIAVALLAWRYLSIFQEMTLRPVYSWDTWMNWAPKAKIWLHHSALVEFVGPREWLSRGGDLSVYTLGNARASTYPPTVPLITLWHMLALGTDDHSYVFIPWWLLAINLGLAFYGHLRMAGASILAATLACYILLSLPYINVHIVQPGYADLWLSATFTLAFVSFSAAHGKGNRAYWILCIFYAFFCSQLKMPGVVLSLIVFFVLLRHLLRLKQAWEYAGAGLLIALSIMALTLGLNLELPLLGSFSVSGNEIVSSFFGTFTLEYHPVTAAFRDSLLLMINWNLLWYACIALVLAKILSPEITKRMSNETLMICLTVLFILFVFYFTRHHKAATNFTTLNRAILYLVPPMIYYLFMFGPQLPTKGPARNTGE